MNPIFIIGAARSGTKFLRDTLGASDNLAVIPYDINFVWRHKNRSLEHDRISISHLSSRDTSWIKNTIYDFASKDLTCTNTPKSFLEKTVSNSLRVSCLYSLFPAAKFIFLRRNPLPTILSSLNQWTAKSDYRYLFKKLEYLPSSKYDYLFGQLVRKIPIINRFCNPYVWGVSYPGIYFDLANRPLHFVCCQQWIQSVQFALNDFKSIPSDRIFSLSYEELVSDTTHLSNLCDFIGISKEPVLDAYGSSLLTGRNSSCLSSFDSKLIDSINSVVASSSSSSSFSSLF